MSSEILFLVLLPVVAFLYAAVGHGGASGYLALMALLNFTPDEMRPTALVLNLVVAGVSFMHFWKQGWFRKHLFFVFAIGSIPLSFIGGSLSINPDWYKVILGVLLLVAVVRMLLVSPSKNGEIRPIKTLEGLVVGGAIGFVSGLIGIGGGIILSPVIVLMRWGTVKEAAAVSALFIWVNSTAGLLGQFSSGIHVNSQWLLFASVALIGGFLGGYVGSSRLKNAGLKYLLVGVLLLAIIKLLLT